MGAVNILHVLFLVVAFLFIVPVSRILSRAGFKGIWAIFCLVPVANIVLLWVFAFSRWPNLPDKTS